MIMIDSAAKKKRILEYVRAFKAKQDELETMDTSIYSIVPIGVAQKYNIIYSDFLLHPMLLKRRKFYEDVEFIRSKANVASLIAKVLEHEFQCSVHDASLTDETIKKLAKVYTKLTKPRRKPNAV